MQMPFGMFGMIDFLSMDGKLKNSFIMVIIKSRIKE